MTEKPLFKTGVAGTPHVLAFSDRYEVHTPRAISMGLTSKKEVYPWATVRDIQTRGGNVTVHFGPLSVRNYSIGRKNAEAFVNAFRSFHAR